MTQMQRTLLYPYSWMLHTKFGYDWPRMCLNIVDGQRRLTTEHRYTISSPDEPSAKVN